jgi:hypothetical protein
MAKVYIGIDRGAQEALDEITVGSSTGNTDVELVLDDASGITRADVKLLTERLIRFVVNGENSAEFPPA